MERLAASALEKGANNIAFAAYLQLGNAKSCVELLAKTGRLPEAAMFARTYAPQLVDGVVARWKAELDEAGRGKIAETIATMSGERELFPEGAPDQGQGRGQGEGSSSSATAARESTHEGRGESEGSGVMVEKPEEEGYAVDSDKAAASADAEAPPKEEEENEEEGAEHHGLKEKAKEMKEKVKEKVVEPVEGLVDKVKDLGVGNGHGECAPSYTQLPRTSVAP